MPADRFFIEDPLVNGTVVTIEGPEQHHLRVMRVAVGETVELVNGKGALGIGRLEVLDKKSAELKIEKVSHEPSPLKPIFLAVPLMRPAKLELIVEKGTELGADGFLFYPAEHSEKEGLSANQIERLRHLSISALKQSGRLHLPALQILTGIKEIFKVGALVFFGDVAKEAPRLTPVDESIIFITGPEQGFSQNEEKILREKCKGVRINANILRAETAPIAAAAILARI